MNQFIHKKSLGQNFLNNEKIINNIVSSCDFDKDTIILEIGPGEGALTLELVKKAPYVIIYEIDNRLEKILRHKLKDHNNFNLIMEDFLQSDVKKEVERFNDKKIKVIANLPYYITTPIVLKLIEDINPDEITIMVQKEVADRFSSSVNSKNYGEITVFLKTYYDIEKLFDVDRNNFDPAPNVDSSVIKFRKNNNHLKINNKDIYFKLLHDSFQFKRKNLRNNLKNYDLEKVSFILNKNDLTLNDRAENISIDTFIEIANNL